MPRFRMPGDQRSVVNSPEPLRRSGIDPIGDRPWGTHICLFYETTRDLLDANVDYLNAGLTNGEFCIWALSGSVTREMAIERLRDSIPDFDRYLREGRIELVRGYDWYLGGGEFDHRRIIRSWHDKLEEALARGFSGMRVSGNAFWSETSTWNKFCEYETELDGTLAGRKMLVLCTYALEASRAIDVLEVTRSHHFSVVIRNGQWEVVGTAELGGPRQKISPSNTPVKIGRLTSREQVVLSQLIGGASSKEAARALSISPRTVEFHRGNIMRKLGARNTADLIGIVLGSDALRET